jgi:endonuclease/exonuclease/phosphatase family metal-dependent hydrolase/predicted kinase
MTSSVACDSVSPKRLKVLTWNVNSDEGDGVAPLRLRAIVAEVESSAADVVFLQEVTVPFKNMLQLQLGSTYHFEDLSAETAEQFFVMVMLRSDRVEKVKSERVDFRDGGTSCMGRYILRIEVRFAGSPASVSLMTSHLESCKQNSQTRMLQYEQLLRLIIEAPANQLQLCCGDFNLREAEDRMVRKRLKASGVDADAAVDSFDAAGRPLDASSTWSRIMDKTQTATSVKARFDRQLFRPGSTAFSLWNGSFKLLGTDIVPGIDESIVRSSGFATPSDHMGILCEYTCGSDRAALLPLEVNAFAECVEHAPRTQCSVIIVLVGAPGSGKSTLAALLSPGFVRVSQDELGGRHKCEDAAKAALQHGSNVVVDRCNFDSQQRSTWLSIAHKFSARAVAVLFDVPLNVCLHRVAARRGHEGGVQGNSETAIDIVTKIHVSLKCVEGDEGFSRIHVFQHTTSPQEIAVELTAAYGTPATSHHFRPTPVQSHPSTRPLRFSSSAQPVGVQCDSSSSESSQERDGSSPAPLFSSAAASARLPEQTQTQSSAAPVVAEEADAYGDDCVLVQHVPSRSCVFNRLCRCTWPHFVLTGSALFLAYFPPTLRYFVLKSCCRLLRYCCTTARQSEERSRCRGRSNIINCRRTPCQERQRQGSQDACSKI